MASNLKALIEQRDLSGDLASFGGVIDNFLQHRYSGGDRSSSTCWRTDHDGKPINLDDRTYNALRKWASGNFIRPFTRNLFACTKLKRGNVIYQPFSEGSGDSCVLFRPRGSTVPIRGRIDTILEEPSVAVPILGMPRIILVVRAWTPLNEKDKKLDPYSNHPLVGEARFGIMALYYDEVDSQSAYIIEPNDVISHVAVTKYADPSGHLSAHCVVLVDLDMVSVCRMINFFSS
jgi:hypothetical protein